MADFVSKKIVTPVVAALKSGATPEKLALSLALGFAIGCFPIIGTSWILANLAVVASGLNPVVMNVANIVATPFAVAGLPLFARLGHRLIRSETALAGVEALLAGLKTDILGTLRSFRVTVGLAILGWAFTIPFLTGVLYLALVPILKKVRPRKSE